MVVAIAATSILVRSKGAGMGAADRIGESKPKEQFGGFLQAAAFQMFHAVAGSPLAEHFRFVVRQQAGGAGGDLGCFLKGQAG